MKPQSGGGGCVRRWLCGRRPEGEPMAKGRGHDGPNMGQPVCGLRKVACTLWTQLAARGGQAGQKERPSVPWPKPAEGCKKVELLRASYADRRRSGRSLWWIQFFERLKVTDDDLTYVHRFRYFFYSSQSIPRNYSMTRRKGATN